MTTPTDYKAENERLRELLRRSRDCVAGCVRVAHDVKGGLLSEIDQALQPQEDEAEPRRHRNHLAEYFIRGFQAGAERPEDAGDGDAMYQAFRDYHDHPEADTEPEPKDCPECGGTGSRTNANAQYTPCPTCEGSGKADR